MEKAPQRDWKELDEMIRDFTSVVPRSKSEVRTRILSLLSQFLTDIVPREDSHMPTCYFLNDGSYKDSHCTCGKLKIDKFRREIINRAKENWGIEIK